MRLTVFRLVGGFSRAQSNFALHGAVMQLCAVGNLNDADSMTNSGQRFISDLGGNRVRIVQVQAVKHLAAGIRAIEHFHFQLKVETGASVGRLGFGIGDPHVVPSGRDGVECGGWGDG